MTLTQEESAKVVRQKESGNKRQKSDRSVGQGDQNATKNGKGDWTPFADLLLWQIARQPENSNGIAKMSCFWLADEDLSGCGNSLSCESASAMWNHLLLLAIVLFGALGKLGSWIRVLWTRAPLQNRSLIVVSTPENSVGSVLLRGEAPRIHMDIVYAHLALSEARTNWDCPYPQAQTRCSKELVCLDSPHVFLMQCYHMCKWCVSDFIVRRG